jgi:hypothetical protein
MTKVSLHHALLRGLTGVALVAGLASATPAHAQVAVAGAPEEDAMAVAEPLDARLLRVADAVPEFGGVFRDKDGVLAVYLTNAAQRDRAQAALQQELGGSIASKGLRVLQGRYGFAELTRFKAKVDPALEFAGVTMTDLDEAHNRVTIGVETRADVARVKVDAQRYGLPADALSVVVTGPIHTMATLRDKIRPVVGGLQIHFGNYLCTEGFPASRAGVRGFVTNSHCSNQYGGNTSTVYYQPVRSSTSRIGVESVDPYFRTGGSCPAGRVCRYSDSAFVRLDSAVKYSKGRIAKPVGLGSRTINSSSPAFRISAEASSVLVGETLNKVGRTTGWTRGTVRYTCVTTSVSGSNATFYCQDWVAAGVNGGDSGSAVFKVTTSPDRVKLYGVLWGGGGGYFVFSRFSNIQRELGTLSTCDPALAGC